MKDGVTVQSIGFRKYLPVGRPEIAVEYLDRWGVDEIVLTHIDGTRRGEALGADLVRSYARRCQVPLTVGGGIAAVDDVTRIIQAGADKVVINTAAALNPALVEEAARRFGAQCIVASIDARRQPDGGYAAFTHGGTRPAPAGVRDLARRLELAGAGEILINSIDRDGSREGYDLDLLRSTVRAVSIPVIGCGGAGYPDHMRDAIRTGVGAVAAANMLHFVEHSVILIKRYLLDNGEGVRLDSYADYRGARLDDDGRLAKRDDAALETLRFRYIPEEVI